jgi:hypothetical protein
VAYASVCFDAIPNEFQRGRVPCLGFSGRRCTSAQGPRPLTDRRPQRAAPPATHPRCRSLELRTSGPSSAALSRSRNPCSAARSDTAPAQHAPGATVSSQ